MADFTISISNSINLFEDDSLWGTMLWGTGFWGAGNEDKIVAIGKNLAESLTVTDAISLAAGFNVSLADSISTSFEMSEESLKDGAGYDYVFTGPSTDAEDRNLATFSEVIDGTTAWTSAAVSATSWSEQS